VGKNDLGEVDVHVGFLGVRLAGVLDVGERHVEFVGGEGVIGGDGRGEEAVADETVGVRGLRGEADRARAKACQKGKSLLFHGIVFRVEVGE